MPSVSRKVAEWKYLSDPKDGATCRMEKGWKRLIQSQLAGGDVDVDVAPKTRPIWKLQSLDVPSAFSPPNILRKQVVLDVYRSQGRKNGTLCSSRLRCWPETQMPEIPRYCETCLTRIHQTVKRRERWLTHIMIRTVGQKHDIESSWQSRRI